MAEYAITIKPHWADSIFHLWKYVENRSWALLKKYECRRIWIHSGKTTTNKEIVDYWDYLKEIDAMPNRLMNFSDFPRGAIVGSLKFSAMPYHLAMEEDWHMEDHNAWAISDAVLLPEPIPAKGKLGFWDWTELITQN